MTAEVCVDCDVALVHAETLAADARALAEFPPASELECVRVAPFAWMELLAQELQERGVTLRVERARAEDAPDGQNAEIFGDIAQLFGLYVRAEDLALARELDGSIAAQLIPDESPALAEGEEDACPGCGAVLGPDAVECPDCGLSFA